MNSYIVSIIGRTNVGKSTIFNRLLGYKRSVVSDSEHVTRDRIYDSKSVNNINYIFIDTGGILRKAKNFILKSSRDHVEIAIQESDIILFVVDNNSGIQDEDYWIFNKISIYKKPILLIVNKVDSLSKINYEIEKFPIKNKLYISAIHNKYIYKIYDFLEEQSALIKSRIKKDKDLFMKVSIIGVTNSGKSLLFNKILKTSRNIVSNELNTTRDIITDSFIRDKKKYQLIDTPGIRVENRTSENILYYSYLQTFKAIHYSDFIFYVLDIKNSITKQVKKIYSYVEKSKKPMIILINKVDLVNSDYVKKYIKNLYEDLPSSKNYKIISISALKGLRVGKLIPEMNKIYKQIETYIPTSKINQFLSDFQILNDISSRSQNVNIYYGSQIKNTKPITFIFSVNSKKFITRNYLIFLKKSLIRSFNIKYIPIDLKFKEH